MKIILARQNDAMHMVAENDSHNTVAMDGTPDLGGLNLGMRPMQLLLAALAGCSSIDVLSILSKMQQKVDDFRVEVTGEREKVGEANLFKKIHLHFILTGNISPEKVERAIELSLTKYCSVSKMIDNVATITGDFEIL